MRPNFRWKNPLHSCLNQTSDDLKRICSRRQTAPGGGSAIEPIANTGCAAPLDPKIAVLRKTDECVSFRFPSIPLFHSPTYRPMNVRIVLSFPNHCITCIASLHRFSASPMRRERRSADASTDSTRSTRSLSTCRRGCLRCLRTPPSSWSLCPPCPAKRSKCCRRPTTSSAGRGRSRPSIEPSSATSR